MLTLDKSTGTASIEFTRPDGTTFTATIRPPSIGQFKRLRFEAQKALRDAQDALKEWSTQADARAEALNETDPALRQQKLEELPDPGDQIDRLSRYTDLMAERTVAWWRLLLIGDDTFRGLTNMKADIEALSTDDWPGYLVYGGEAISNGVNGQAMVAKTGTAQVLLAFWQEAPLDRGARQPAPS